MVPAFLSIIPQVLILQSIKLPWASGMGGLVGTRTGLVLLYMGTGVCGNTFFLRSSFAPLPLELEESVKIDDGILALLSFG